VERRNAALLTARQRDATAAAAPRVAAATSFEDDVPSARGLRRPRNLNGKSAASVKARASYRDQLMSKLGLSEALEEHQLAFKQIHRHLKRNPPNGMHRDVGDEVADEDLTGEANDSQDDDLRHHDHYRWL
jgi:hypothetical protein